MSNIVTSTNVAILTSYHTQIAKFIQNNYRPQLTNITLSYTSEHIKAWSTGTHVFFGFLNNSGEISGIIGGKIVSLCKNGSNKQCVEVNFLCIQINMRGEDLHKILISSVINWGNDLGVSEAVYTSSDLHGYPVAVSNYYHYLCHSNIVPILYDFTIEIMQASQIKTILHQYEEFKKRTYSVYIHNDIDNFMSSNVFVKYVIKDTLNKIIGFVLLLRLDIVSPIDIRKCYYIHSYFNEPEISLETVFELVLSHTDLQDYEIQCLDTMLNNKIIKHFGFNKGTGRLNFYMFNNTSTIKNNDIGYFLI